MTSFQSDLPRREFLKVVGALGVASTGVASIAQVARVAEAASEVSSTVANMAMGTSASHFGYFNTNVVGGTLKSVIPHPTDPSPSPMVKALPDLVFRQSRVKYPMVRRGYLKDGYKSDTSERGKGDFVRVSWNEALDLVANEVKRVKTTYGNQAIYGGSYGWQSTGSLHAASAVMQRFLNGYGGFTGSIGDYSTMAAQRIMPHVVGSISVYEQQTSWPVVLKNTKLIVLWGADLMQTNQIDWVTPDHYVYTVLPQLKGSSIRVVSINPYRTDAAVYLNAEHIGIKPNTDVAMMLAMAYVLYTEKKYDASFLSTYTVGFDKFINYVTGKSDGQPKTPAWAEKISGVPASTISALALDMARNRTMIMGGWGIQRQDHGEQPHWMMVTLAAMLGQIGLPGGGFGFSYHYCSGGSPTSVGPALGGIPSTLGAATRATAGSWLGHVSHSIPVTRMADMLLNPGQTIDFDGLKITYPDIKMIYWVGGNPFVHHQQTNRLIQAWRRPQTIVVNEISWTPTARFADIVLPATTTLERNDIASIGSYSNLGFVAMQKAVNPLYESKSDYEIFTELAGKLGFQNLYTGGRDEMAWIRFFYDTARKQATTQKVAMPDFNTFWKQGVVMFPVADAARNFVTYSDFRSDPSSNPLSTPSGLIEIYSNTIAKFNYPDCPPHPTWMEPVEWLGSSTAAKYPLHLTSPHPKNRLHSQLDNTAFEQQFKVHGRALVWMHPTDAAARGLKTGDVVRVFNSRGAVLASLEVTDRIRPSVVRMEEGSWYDPASKGSIGTLDKEGSPNTLTLDKATSRLAQGENVNSNLVQIEKYAGAIPAVTAYTAPAGA